MGNGLRFWGRTFGQSAWRWLVIVPFAILGAFDTSISQLGPEEWQVDPPRLIEILPGLSWQSWALIILAVILVIVLESAYRYSQKTQSSVLVSGGSQLDEIITAMQNITIGPSQHARDLATILGMLADDLALGIDHDRMRDLLRNATGGRWLHWARKVIAQLTIFNAIDFRKVEPSPNAFAVMFDMKIEQKPTDEYYLTEQGKRLVQRLSSHANFQASLLKASRAATL